MKQRLEIPLLGFAAYSGTGKTTLLEKLLPKLTDMGLRVGVLKHAHHNFDVDKPGKDSYRLRKAGASQMLISSRNRFALMTETPDRESEFDYLLSRFDTTQLDIVLVEGCKNICFPKIELHREVVGKPWLYANDSNIIAIAADSRPEGANCPFMDINNLDAIAAFVQQYVDKFNNKPSVTPTSCDALSPAFLSVAEGVEKILARIQPIDDSRTEDVASAHKKVLFNDVISPINVPAYTNSAMDGYAIRGDDIGRDCYQVMAEVKAGYHYAKPLLKGEAVKIMTGAPLPEHADTVVMREESKRNGDIVTFSGAKIRSGRTSVVPEKI